MACRQEAGKAELVRFVRRPNGEIALDSTGRAPGRGAYLHATTACIDLARKRRALPPEVLSLLRPA
ncbi:MAG TPA: YlxR family protein [Candidatus Dormibacteraeota bacterium]|nr:YlxR family protein [Candidatus Dormibacteraeota bacterium]